MSITDIADRVEFQTWAEGKVCSLSSVKEVLESGSSQEEDEINPDVDEKLFALAQQVFDEFEVRARILRSRYPFTLDGETIRPSVPALSSSPYAFCLALSLVDHSRIPLEIRCEGFETLALSAAQSFFGGEGIRIGAPWKNSRFSTYSSLLAAVARLAPELGEPTCEQAPGGGDRGWDVVVVKNFADNRTPRLIAIGNCATGQTNWREKWRETAPEYFWKCFTHQPVSARLGFFAVPFIMEDDQLSTKSDGKTIVFDRLRLCEHATALSDQAQSWLTAQGGAASEMPLR